MARLDLELSARSIDGLRKLARAHYGDDSDASVNKVMEAALALRLEWLAVAGEAAQRTEDPVLQWVDDPLAHPSAQAAVVEWLFEEG